MQNTFCMHSGCHEVSHTELANVRVPAATQSWRPLGHDLVRSNMLAAITNVGLTVTRERWALSDVSQKQAGRQVDKGDTDVINQDGNRCFGLIELGTLDPSDDWSIAIGIQNSLDKTLALRRIVAASVFICDNLVLSTTDANGVVTFRKHTSMIDLIAECQKTADTALAGFEPFREFINGLKSAPCNNDKFNAIVCQSIQQGVMPGTAANDMLRAWYANEAPKSNGVDWSGFQNRLDDGFYSDRNGWTAHGLWTDAVGKRINPTAAGNALIDNQAKFNSIVSNVLLN